MPQRLWSPALNAYTRRRSFHFLIGKWLKDAHESGLIEEATVIEQLHPSPRSENNEFVFTPDHVVIGT